jgi:hypothetical protein
MNPADNLERSIEQLHITTKAETDNRILSASLTALQTAVQKQQPGIRDAVWRTVVIRRIVGLAAVAAVIIIGFVCLFRIPGQKTVELREIYEALEKVNNVCITTFLPDRNEPIQSQWISRALNVSMFRIAEQFVLWDIPNKVKKTKRLSSESIKVETPSKELLSRLEKGIINNFGLLAFTDYKDVPKGAQWNRLDDPEVAAIVPGAEVYDLIWTTQTKVIEFHKWRYFVDTSRNLPIRAEIYSKKASEQEYTLYKYEVIIYLTEAEIKALIRNTFGSAAVRPGEPGYISTPGANR